MKTFLLLALSCAGTLCMAADLPVSKNTVLFSDDFARKELGDAWHIAFPSFVIADGVLKASQTKPEHGAVGLVKVGRKNLVIEFKFRLGGATGINAVCNDKDYKEGHGGHICRVTLSPKQIFLADDKERLRHEIEEMQKDPARKDEVKKLTAGRTKNIPLALAPERWYHLRITIVDDEMRVSLDDKELGSLKSSGIAHPTKSDFYFTVSGKDASFDDMRITGLD